jgi:hypothetical protein
VTYASTEVGVLADFPAVTALGVQGPYSGKMSFSINP